MVDLLELSKITNSWLHARFTTPGIDHEGFWSFRSYRCCLLAYGPFLAICFSSPEALKREEDPGLALCPIVFPALVWPCLIDFCVRIGLNLLFHVPWLNHYPSIISTWCWLGTVFPRPISYSLSTFDRDEQEWFLKFLRPYGLNAPDHTYFLCIQCLAHFPDLIFMCFEALSLEWSLREPLQFVYAFLLLLKSRGE